MRSSASSRALPTSTSRPPTRARAPRPAYAWKSVTARVAATPRALACATIAAASGCSDARSSDGHERKRLGRVDALGPPLLRDDRPALRERARLVEHDGRQFARALQRVAPLDQDAEVRALARGDHHRRGHREAHRARTRDDQHRDGCGEPAHERALAAEQPPRRQRQQGDADDDRHEHGADAIGEVLDGRARRLGIAHQPDDPRQHAGGARASWRGRRSRPCR